ncbi:MAG TPA: universal stress protein [Stellaceae bacterium]|nr:universal stress protein [Stellaceae bacterium]
MKSILVALDNTPAAKSAGDVALGLAQQHQAAVMALSVVDLDYLAPPEPVPLGGTAFKAAADAARIERASREIDKLLHEFEAKRQRHKLLGEALRINGAPLPALTRAATGHDLVVIGRDTSFHAVPSRETALTVELLLKRNPRPVLVVPPLESVNEMGSILIAFDGSLAAAKALQIFALLDLAKKTKLRLLSIAPDEKEAQDLVAEAAGYLALYGISPERHGIVATADIAGTLLAETKRWKPDMLVMGAFGHRGWREALLGSCTKSLLRACPTSLFIHH